MKGKTIEQIAREAAGEAEAMQSHVREMREATIEAKARLEGIVIGAVIGLVGALLGFSLPLGW